MKPHWTSFDISTGVETYRGKLTVVFTKHAIVRILKRFRGSMEQEIPNEFLHWCGCCVKDRQEFVGLTGGIVYFCLREGDKIVVKTVYKDIKKPGHRYGLRQFKDIETI